MRVLDLFSGLRGWSDPWKARGHEVITLDNEPYFEPDLEMDIMWFAENPLEHLDGWRPDVILASPPCEKFSVMTIGRNWTREHEPKTDDARIALALVEATVRVIHELRPSFFIIENPRAKLRRLPPVQHLDRVTVTYCQYGEPFMKPTDLWGGFPASWWPRPPCKNGSPCHIAAARGSRTGIQGPKASERLQLFQRGGGPITPEDETLLRGLGYDPGGKSNSSFGPIGHLQATAWSTSPKRKYAAAARAKIPTELSLSICEAAEKDMT